MQPRWSAIALVVGGALASGSCLVVPPGQVAPEAPVEEAKAVWKAGAVGGLYDTGEVRAFEILQGGRVIGRSWGRYRGSIEGDRHRFETRIELIVPGRDPLHSAGEIVLDGTGRLVEGFERSEAAQIVFRRQRDVLVLDIGRSSDEVGYEPERRDVAFMAHSAILHEELMFALRDMTEGELAWRLVSLSGGVPTQWSAEVRHVGSASTGKVEVRTSLGEIITLEERRIRRIRVEADHVEIVDASARLPWPAWEVSAPRELTYQSPAGAPFERRELELPGRPGEPRLSGEVLLPTAGKPPFAAALFLSGTGRQDRYGFAGPPPVDLGSHEITDAIASAGLAVLRYDERGFGGSEVGGELTYAGQVEDARRALRTLLVQPEVDPDRIVIVAHGEGGWRALEVGRGSPKGLRGIALLGTPGRPYADVFATQAEANLAMIPPEMRKDARKEQRRVLDGIVSGERIPPELTNEATWLRQVMKRDPGKLVAGAPCPLFLAQGGKDFEVDPQRDADALLQAAKRGRRRVKLKRYPDLDHLFKREPGRSTPARYVEADRHVDTAFLTDLVAWVKARTR